MLGSIYRLMGKEGLARANLLATVRLDPDCQSALNMLGALYHQAGEGEKTMDAYQRSLAVNPSTPEGQAARLELGVLQGISKGPLVLHGNPEEKQRELEAQGIVHDTYLTARLNGSSAGITSPICGKSTPSLSSTTPACRPTPCRAAAST